MILIADSGSTTTNWRLLSYPIGIIAKVDTKGLNPYHLTENEIITVLKYDLHPVIKDYSINKIIFYGSGCSNDNKKEIIKQSLLTICPNACIIVDHDIMASAIASCGDDIGIACILGTGSNSCVYDGENIIKTLPSLGYMLGDEGSGTNIGKRLLTLYLKNHLPTHLHNLFFEKYGFTSLDILNGLYQKEKPGAFISQFAQFVYENIKEECMQNIVRNAFRDFFNELVLPYPESKTYPVNFVGSIAAMFSEILREVAEEKSLKIQHIVRYPIEALTEYHLKRMK